MSEQWPGEKPDVSDVEEEADEAESEVAETYDDDDQDDEEEEPELHVHEHADDGIEIPDEVELLEGEPRSTRRNVGVVVAKTRPQIANALLAGALAELEQIGVGREHVTVMLVPTAFELAIGAMALAKTRRYSCVIALGEAPDSEVLVSEAASGLQLAGLETGIPVSFGLRLDGVDAAEHGREAARQALEMADLFQQVRAAAKAV
jgi:6,7-dimethyl-8-ribityllumazine synthase